MKFVLTTDNVNTLLANILGLYRISAPAPSGIRHFFQIRQKSGSGKKHTGAR